MPRFNNYYRRAAGSLPPNFGVKLAAGRLPRPAAEPLSESSSRRSLQKAQVQKLNRVQVYSFVLAFYRVVLRTTVTTIGSHARAGDRVSGSEVQ
jgi:hypothetical protein